MKLFNSKEHSSRNRQQDSFGHRIANDPYLDWMMLVIIAVILAGVLIGVGFISYNDTQIRLSSPTTGGTGVHQSLFDTEAMNRTLKTFSARADEQATLIKGYSGVADPSL
jgi:hypothetical protein